MRSTGVVSRPSEHCGVAPCTGWTAARGAGVGRSAPRARNGRDDAALRRRDVRVSQHQQVLAPENLGTGTDASSTRSGEHPREAAPPGPRPASRGPPASAGVASACHGPASRRQNPPARHSCEQRSDEPWPRGPPGPSRGARPSRRRRERHGHEDRGAGESPAPSSRGVHPARPAWRRAGDTSHESRLDQLTLVLQGIRHGPRVSSSATRTPSRHRRADRAPCTRESPRNGHPHPSAACAPSEGLTLARRFRLT